MRHITRHIRPANAKIRYLVPSMRRALLTSSYSSGPSEPPLFEQTIPQHFASVVSQFGDRTAVVSRGQQQRLTYDELNSMSNTLAKGLMQLGVNKGERVAVSLGNNVEFAVTTYALFKLGAILVPLNPAFNSTQVISALSHLSASHLIIGTETNLPYKPPRENISLLKKIAPDIESVGRVESASVPSLQNIILVNNSAGITQELRGAKPFNDLFSSQLLTELETGALHPDEIVNIQFTSGTTSTPKAACLTHRSILNNGYFIGLRMGLTSRDIVCCPPPLFHCFGCILGYMATATHGSAIVFPAEAFNPEATLRAIQEEKATALYGVGTMFVAELELLVNGTVPYEGFEHLRTGIVAGSSVPSTLMRKLHEMLNLTGLTICYGMTETSPVSCMTKPDDPLQKRLDSVGQLLPHVEAKVVSVDDRSYVLPIGEKGELAVAGYNVMEGYWDDEARTKEVRVIEKDEETGKRKVWMYTGDEALMDGDGYVKITGRIKDLIIRGGENIHPLEVENVLFAHPAVSEASVVGLPDEKYGECVAAFVIAHGGVALENDSHQGNEIGGRCDAKNNQAGEVAQEKQSPEDKVLTKAELKIWVRENLSHHLVPRYIFWAKEYPKTASGKIQKYKLRDEAIKLIAKGKGT